jgi:hypothetical protein
MTMILECAETSRIALSASIPFHVGHEQIEQDDVRTPLFENSNGLSAINRDAYIVAGGDQSLGKHFTNIGVVVSHQDPGHPAKSSGVHSSARDHRRHKRSESRQKSELPR